MQTFGGPLRKKGFDDLGAVDWGSVPDDKQLSFDLAHQHLQERYHLFGFICSLLCLHNDSPFRRDPPNRRKVIPRQRH